VESSTYSLTHSTYLPPPTSIYPPLSSYTYAAQPSPTPIYPLSYLTEESQSFNDSNLTSQSKVIPKLKEFLEGLDLIYGKGKYTQYLDIFEKNDIRVNLIPKISNEWWENKLQIVSLGHILTLKEEANKYI